MSEKGAFRSSMSKCAMQENSLRNTCLNRIKIIRILIFVNIGYDINNCLISLENMIMKIIFLYEKIINDMNSDIIQVIIAS